MTESGGGWLGREWSPRVPVRQDVVVGGGRESSSGSLGGWSETSGVPGYRGTGVPGAPRVPRRLTAASWKPGPAVYGCGRQWSRTCPRTVYGGRGGLASPTLGWREPPETAWATGALREPLGDWGAGGTPMTADRLAGTGMGRGNRKEGRLLLQESTLSDCYGHWGSQVPAVPGLPPAAHGGWILQVPPTRFPRR